MSRTPIVLFLAVVLFAVYVGLFRRSEQFAVESGGARPSQRNPLLETPARAPFIEAPPAPTAVPLAATVTVVPPPTEHDPLAPAYKNRSFPDEIRAPENLFGPAPIPSDVQIAAESGVAGAPVPLPAIDNFGPEAAQNGGEFMGGIVAYDTEEATNFSAF